MKISEKPFYSIQGEGKNTGKLCTWLRVFGCDLQCRGFSQDEPANPASWKPQFPEIIDPKRITCVEEIPLPVTGCDSAFSWSPAFKHLYPDRTPNYYAEEVLNLLPNKKFNKVGHIFTGGEPMLYQQDLHDVFRSWVAATPLNIPNWLGIETNGTRELHPSKFIMMRDMLGSDFYFSISPKLLHVSGEKEKKAHRPDIAASYIQFAPSSYLKFVVNTDPRAWEQLTRYVDDISTLLGYTPEVWVMACGATVEQQESEYTPIIADMAISKGYNFSVRAHVITWGNAQIGK